MMKARIKSENILPQLQRVSVIVRGLMDVIFVRPLPVAYIGKVSISGGALIFSYLILTSMLNDDSFKSGLFDLVKEGNKTNQFCVSELTFLNPAGPVTGLVSVPGSGSNWVRHLLQQATGISTGAIFNDSSLRKNGFPGQGVKDGSVLVIQSSYDPLWWYYEAAYERVVVIVRQPSNAALAEFDRRQILANLTGLTGTDKFRTIRWDLFAKRYLTTWVNFHKYVMQNFARDKICVLQYERLLANSVQELSPCLRFLGVKSIRPPLANCVRRILPRQHPQDFTPDPQRLLGHFTQEEADRYHKTWQETLEELLNHSVNTMNVFSDDFWW